MAPTRSVSAPERARAAGEGAAAGSGVSIIIPVENQVREFDPKLLLACVAAARGIPAVIGSRREIDFRIASLDRGVYLAKSLTVRSVPMFRILRKLGHEIFAWDEEALVHLPAETYYSRRLSPEALRYVSRLLAWGQDNVELLEGYPGLGRVPVAATGNPRNDFLRPELRGLFREEVAGYRAAHGDFILVNTNFNHVNAFYPEQNLFRPAAAPGAEPEFGRAARGMTREYATGLREHKQAIFEHFQRLIPALAERFPAHAIVVRPHPTERQDVYRRIASGSARVRVTNEGNVVPWLLAARALVHNGCTTGLEAWVLGAPAVSYRPRVDDRYDDDFYRLPNRVSHQAFDLDGLVQTLRRILAGELGAPDGAERKALVDHCLAAREGPLACARIVDLVEEVLRGRPALPPPPVGDRITGWYLATRRRWKKRWKGLRSESPASAEFQRHRYPRLSLAGVRARVAVLARALPEASVPEVEQIADEVFRISRQAAPAAHADVPRRARVPAARR
jgi:surface carbohydrate biosynthesis protein